MQASGEPLHVLVVANQLYDQDKAKIEVLRQALMRIEGSKAVHERQQQEVKKNAQMQNMRTQDQALKAGDLSNLGPDKGQSGEYTAEDYDDFNKVCVLGIPLK